MASRDNRQVLANMGNGVSCDISRDAFGSGSTTPHHSNSLCDIRHLLGLPSARVAGVGNMASNSTQERRNCLAYLTSLVQTVASDAPHILSERLIEEFGSLAGVLAADEYALNRIAAPFPHVIAFLLLLKNATLHALAFEVRQAPIIATGHALRDYLFARLSHATAEQFRVLFLDMQHMLIRDEVMGIGSVSQTSAYPREIIKRALELGATKLILVHNHPSGDSTASPSDIKLTRDIANVCRHLELSLIDHIIIARSNWSSFRAAGLL